jgi:hypothetical protein
MLHVCPLGPAIGNSPADRAAPLGSRSRANILTRRANHLQIFILARIKPADERSGDLAEADRTGRSGAITDGGELYKFVTTGFTRRYPIDGGAGTMIVATSPFYANDGARTAFIDASPERPLIVRIQQDGTFTISRP